MARPAFQLRKLSDSAANAFRLKAKQKSLVASDVSPRLSILRVNEFVSPAKPAAQLLRRLCDRAGPTATRECPFDFGRGGILPQREQCHARAFRKRQLEITRL